ncbi:hypothetical protein ACSQ67_010488 [Phaseolus vulgaris]
MGFVSIIDQSVFSFDFRVFDPRDIRTLHNGILPCDGLSPDGLIVMETIVVGDVPMLNVEKVIASSTTKSSKLDTSPTSMRLETRCRNAYEFTPKTRGRFIRDGEKRCISSIMYCFQSIYGSRIGQTNMRRREIVR